MSYVAPVDEKDGGLQVVDAEVLGRCVVLLRSLLDVEKAVAFEERSPLKVKLVEPLSVP